MSRTPHGELYYQLHTAKGTSVTKMKNTKELMHCHCGTNNRAPRWTFTDLSFGFEGHKEHCHPGTTLSKWVLEGHKEHCHPGTTLSKFDLEGHKEHCHPDTTHSKCDLEGNKEHCHPGTTHSKFDLEGHKA